CSRRAGPGRRRAGTARAYRAWAAARRGLRAASHKDGRAHRADRDSSHSAGSCAASALVPAWVSLLSWREKEAPRHGTSHCAAVSAPAYSLFQSTHVTAVTGAVLAVAHAIARCQPALLRDAARTSAASPRRSARGDGPRRRSFARSW